MYCCLPEYAGRICIGYDDTGKPEYIGEKDEGLIGLAFYVNGELLNYCEPYCAGPHDQMNVTMGKEDVYSFKGQFAKEKANDRSRNKQTGVGLCAMIETPKGSEKDKISLGSRDSIDSQGNLNAVSPGDRPKAKSELEEEKSG